jgi:hypothetical protein
MKLQIQQIKNQDNQRFLQAVMPESPSATRPKISRAIFSIELYFDICSVLYRGEIHEKETERR